MTFWEGLHRARSHLVFLLALGVAFPLIIFLDQTGKTWSQSDQRQGSDITQALVNRQEISPAILTPLREDQLAWGRIAWRYFERNIEPATGLANSADGYRSTTMWDTASFLLGLIAAERIGIVDGDSFDRHISAALASLAKLPLFDESLPNKAYNTLTLSMVDYNNQPTTRGLGWSALDIARLMVPLAILQRSYEKHAPAAREVLDRWRLDRLIKDGTFVGASVDSAGLTTLHQEGRVGYEEYAAKALLLYGFDIFQAWRTDDTITFELVEGVPVPVDGRSAGEFGAQVYTTSEPYLLDGLEFGFDARSRAFAGQLYAAQEKRFENTGILTAVSEGHLSKPPNFAYATVFGNGAPWAVLTDTGERHDELRTLSTKTAFGLDALYATPYTAQLMNTALRLNNPSGGWIEGLYERDSTANGAETANTNGIVLESLHYRAFGPMLHPLGKVR